MDEVLAKRCRECRVVVPVANLVRDTKARGGVDRLCQSCKNTTSRQWHKDNTPRTRANRRAWRERNRTRAAEAQRRWRSANPVTTAKYLDKWRTRNPEKRRAHTAVANALRAGTLARQPCEVCGATADVHAHHDDYTKPLDVRWLCRAHHVEEHHGR